MRSYDYHTLFILSSHFIFCASFEFFYKLSPSNLHGHLEWAGHRKFLKCLHRQWERSMATEGFYVKLCYFQLVILLTPVEELMNYMTNSRLRLHVPLFSPAKLLIRVKKIWACGGKSESKLWPTSNHSRWPCDLIGLCIQESRQAITTTGDSQTNRKSCYQV